MLASKLRFKMEPAKHAAMKYKQKLMTMSGAVKPLPIPNAIAAAARIAKLCTVQSWTESGRVGR
jgi:hypothetical protein